MKKETLEEGFNNHYKNINYTQDSIYKETVKRDFFAGYKLAQERSYNEEEVGEILYNAFGEYGKHYGIMLDGALINKLFEQFKKK
jgi:hypothetical protein